MLNDRSYMVILGVNHANTVIRVLEYFGIILAKYIM